SIFREYVFRFDVFLQLHEKAIATNHHVQRKIWLHSVELCGGQKTFTERRHAQIDKRRLKWSLTQPAMALRKVRGGRRHVVLQCDMHRRYFLYCFWCCLLSGPVNK